MPVSSHDTIAAIATPAGVGAIAVIRLSGPDSIKIIRRHLKLPDMIKPRYVYKRDFRNGNTLVDQVLVTYFKAPSSYTGEDLVEISSHGGYLIPNEILRSLIKSGARPAEPGEFTKRAFLNGKIDLLQAEAVADLIRASSEHFRQTTLQILEGNLSRTLQNLRENLLELATLMELELDFQDQEINFTPPEEIEKRLREVINDISKLLRGYLWNRYHREGFLIPIVGYPNAGKSSLLNAILQNERAIVSPHPGTTRDFIEENINLDGIALRLVDTAGIRETMDEIEREGVKRTEDLIRKANLIIYIHDIQEKHRPLPPILKSEKKPVIRVMNKIDLTGKKAEIDSKGWVNLSARTGSGIELLLRKIKEKINNSFPFQESSLAITRERHRRHLEAARRFIRRALKGIYQQPVELTITNIREALHQIGELTGQVTSEEVLNRIFGEFCIGK